MDAALAGLVGTTVGAIAGVAGAWLAQRGQLRLQREQRTYEERVRWLDHKRALYRDLLIAMHGWHDALSSIWKDENDGKLFEVRETAYKWSVEAKLIASNPVRSAIKDLRRAFFAAQPSILTDATSNDAEPPLDEVREGLVRLEITLRAELSEPSRSDIRRSRH